MLWSWQTTHLPVLMDILTLYPTPALLLGSLSAWLVVVLAYRLFVHPLSRFPGPKLAALTEYYGGYYDLIEDGGLLFQIERLHVKYGPIVRVGPNTLHFSDPQAFADIYTNGTTFAKSSLLYDSFFHSYESSHGYVDLHEARVRRGMLNPFFSRRAILKLRYVIQGKIDRLITRIKEYPKGRPIDLSFAFRSLTMEIITEYCFSASYDALEYPDFRHPLVVVFQELIQNFWLSKYFTTPMRLFASSPTWLLLKMNPGMLDYINMKQDLEDRIDRYIKDESALEAVEHETIFHHLILPRTKDGVIDRSLRPSRRSLVDEAFSLLGAGSDTVGNTSCIATLYALSNPDICRKVKEELRQAWPDPETVPELTVLEQLPYLTAFIKESLRFSHGVVTPLPRVVGPSDTRIGGVLVPAGTVVEMSCVLIHKNPEIFKDPETFNPDRWLTPESKDLETYLVPFSRGPRMCLGINLAWCELYLILGSVFRRLDFELYDTSIEDFKDFKEIFVPVWKGSMKVTVKQ
ncbi:hypothetical protein D9758_006320 [Tetrapyrgos nigripes]|uniref:Cytochrome P450 n=1 Tax=Tetrapyrgos nigripes TaxID=182062 RepID=A0A8H5D953_9AGAR|nr:hypothetical protein D9758_006320 [Tetrapyrgos nigripes]